MRAYHDETGSKGMTYIDGYQEGQFAGKNDANKGNWFVGGLFLGLISVIVAFLSSPPITTPPATQSSNEYQSGYVQGYVSARKKANGWAAMAGWIISTAILVIIFSLIFLIDRPLDRPQTVTGWLRVTSDVKGAEVLLDGMQVGVVTDTTLSRVVAGRRSVSVRKPGYLADPEVVFVDVKQDTLTVVTFHLVHRAIEETTFPY